MLLSVSGATETKGRRSSEAGDFFLKIYLSELWLVSWPWTFDKQPDNKIIMTDWKFVCAIEIFGDSLLFILSSLII